MCLHFSDIESEKCRGENSCFPPAPPLALSMRICRATRSSCAASLADASGGLKPFSEEKGFKTLMSATTEKIVKAYNGI